MRRIAIRVLLERKPKCVSDSRLRLVWHVAEKPILDALHDALQMRLGDAIVDSTPLAFAGKKSTALH